MTSTSGAQPRRWGNALQYSDLRPMALRKRADVDLKCPGPRGSATRYPGLRPMASEQARRYPRVCPIAFEEACRYPPLVPKARYWIEEDASRRGVMRFPKHWAPPQKPWAEDPNIEARFPRALGT